MVLYTRHSELFSAAIAAFRAAPATIRARMQDATQAFMVPAWSEEISKTGAMAPSPVAQVVGSGANARAGASGISLFAGSGNGGFSGGLNPSEHARAFEFGTNIEKKTPYATKSRKGKVYVVRNRVTNRQMPSRSRSGWVAYPAAGKVVGRMAALYVAIVAKVTHDAIEGKSL